MVLKPVGGEPYDYIQNSAPSSPREGETWLDTSVNPPESNIYADVGGGLEWLNEAALDLILSNLDTTISSRSSHNDPDPNGYIDMAISNAGASQSDIEAGAEGALAEDISNISNRASNSVATLITQNLQTSVGSRSSHDDPDPNGYIDTPISSRASSTELENKATGVDWSAKTSEHEAGVASYASTEIFSVTGSGYITAVSFYGENQSQPPIVLDIDGTRVVDGTTGLGPKFFNDSSFGNNGLRFRGPHRFDSSFTLDRVGDVPAHWEVVYVLD